MNREQIKQREEIMQQLWSVEDRTSTPQDATLKAAARGAVSKLRALLATVGCDFRDPLNVGKTWRYLGDAYFTLSAKTDETSLRLARQAYLKAEKFLADAHDALETAKLDFNLANTTRLLDGGQSRELLEEARRRYYNARKAFAGVMPEAVASVENSLESLEIVIKGLDFLKTAEEGYRKTNSLKQKLEAAGNDPEEISRIAREFEKLKGEGRRPEDEIRSFQSYLNRVSPLLSSYGSEGEKKIGQIKAALKDLSTDFRPEPDTATATDNAIFGAVFDAVNKAAQRGEVGSDRKETLDRILKEFYDIWNQPEDMPGQMALKSTRMRDLIARYKSVFMNPEFGDR